MSDEQVVGENVWQLRPIPPVSWDEWRRSQGDATACWADLDGWHHHVPIPEGEPTATHLWSSRTDDDDTAVLCRIRLGDGTVRGAEIRSRIEGAPGEYQPVSPLRTTMTAWGDDARISPVTRNAYDNRDQIQVIVVKALDIRSEPAPAHDLIFVPDPSWAGLNP